MARGPQFDMEKHCIDQLVQSRSTRSHLLIAVSGGCDSVALAVAMARVRSRLKGRAPAQKLGPKLRQKHAQELLTLPTLKITWAYIHHGKSNDPEQMRFRNEAEAFLKTLARKENVGLHISRIEMQVESEADFRKERYALLKLIMKTVGADLLVTAHHQDDVLETRLLRLLRGVGPKGLTSLTALRGKLFRPLLTVTRTQLENYLAANKLSKVEDPSNAQIKFARNWLRQVWLRPLQNAKPEWTQGLSRSLSRIAEDLAHYDELLRLEMSKILVQKRALKRSSFNKCDPRIQRGILSHYVRLIQHTTAADSRAEWTRLQIEEVLKRLTSLASLKDSVSHFYVGGLEWLVTEREIMAHVATV